MASLLMAFTHALQKVARVVNLMDDEVFSEDSGSEAVRLAVMKMLTKMAGEAGREITSGTERATSANEILPCELD